MNTIKQMLLAVIIMTAFFIKTYAQTEDYNIKIIYTTDEHGWFMPSDYNSGAAGMYAIWKNLNDFNNDYLILSGGDNWTGPALSTWFKGEPMVEILNNMGYDAAAIGNHEFDFTVDVLRKRVEEMNFPFLAANLYTKKDKKVPDFVKPYVIIPYKDINIGIIGLANIETPIHTNPKNVTQYEFTDYEKAVEKYAKELKNKNVEIIIIIAHICKDEMESLVPVAKKFDIPIITGGHCHHLVTQMKDGVLLVEADSYMNYFTYIELKYSLKDKKAYIYAFDQIKNNTDLKNQSIAEINNKWEKKASKSLKKSIGYNDKIIKRKTKQMRYIISTSWLSYFSDADFIMTNNGGIRQDILIGNITVESIIGLLPFSNSILKLKLTGKQLTQCMQIDDVFVEGTGKIEDNKTYTVLTNDYLYNVNKILQDFDKNPIDTYTNYRQPVIDWIQALKTSKKIPLSKKIQMNE